MILFINPFFLCKQFYAEDDIAITTILTPNQPIVENGCKGSFLMIKDTLSACDIHEMLKAEDVNYHLCEVQKIVDVYCPLMKGILVSFDQSLLYILPFRKRIYNQKEINVSRNVHQLINKTMSSLYSHFSFTDFRLCCSEYSKNQLLGLENVGIINVNSQKNQF